MWGLTFFLTLATCQAQVYYDSNNYYMTTAGTEFIAATQEDCTGAATGTYMPIKDVKACMQAAAIIGKSFDTVYHRYPVNSFPPYCTAKVASNDVNYWINPESVHTDPAWTVLCISTTKTCDVTNATGPVTNSPCVCGSGAGADVCSEGEYCSASNNRCEAMPGIFETERKDKSCPSGYQPITDAVACKEIAESWPERDANGVPLKRWGAVYDYHAVPNGCATWTTGIINYYVAPGASNDDVDVSMLCIDTTARACSVTDGGGPSASYPCVCGSDTCANNEICTANGNWSHCQVSPTIYQTERKTKSCPTGYRAIDEPACWELAKTLGRTWMKFQSYSGVASGCGAWNFDTVQFFDYPGGGAPADDPLYANAEPDNVENSLLCIADGENITYDRCLNPYSWAPCIA